jgi:hypothetical protein
LYGALAAVAVRWLRAVYARTRAYVSLVFGFALYAAVTWFALFSGFPLPVRIAVSLPCALVAILQFSGNAFAIRRVGGLTPKGELWMLNLEIADRWNKHKLTDARDSAQVDAVRHLLGRIEACRTPETAELVDLLTLDYRDRLSRTVPPNILIARGIRIQEIRRRLYPKLAYPPKLDTGEATFRWHFRRALGRVQIAGVAGLSDTEKAQFRELVAALEAYRRDDTTRLIDLVQQSALHWLALDSDEAWSGQAQLTGLSPEVDVLFRKVCPNIEVFSGARLDPEDEVLVRSS